MPESITREEAYERALTLALKMPSAELKDECQRRAAEIARGLDDAAARAIREYGGIVNGKLVFSTVICIRIECFFGTA